MNRKQIQSAHDSVTLGKQRSYNEVVEYLNARWSYNRTDKNLTVMTQLDKAFNNPSKDLNVVSVAGTNGKSLTINFVTQLLREEGLSVGSFYAPHILTYNERFAVNNESIANKQFTELANEVINTAEMQGIEADTLELLTMISFLYFKQKKTDVVFLESSFNTAYDPIAICHPKILVITRVTQDVISAENLTIEQWIERLTEMVQPGTFVVSADQSKLTLQVVLNKSAERGGKWGMPIRKLAALDYPFEQLHGRCAALAERICQIYINNFVQSEGTIVSDSSLLAKEKGRRGRPTLEAKRQLELHPKKTLEQFWKETKNSLPCRFQLIKENPSVLLDNASNVDALQNIFLGIRLLHYQRPLKGITFIFGCDKNTMQIKTFLQDLRYFSRKNSAQAIFCPINNVIPGLQEESVDVEQITNDVKSLKVKAQSVSTFEKAFELAKKSVDERNGLIIITGSHSIIAEYWHSKGIKKL